MKKTLILTLAATIISAAASLSATSSAHAGSGGVKLYFNGPLGSFVARPSRGGSVSGHTAGDYAASTKHKKHGASSFAETKSSKRVKKETTVASIKRKSTTTESETTESTADAPRTGSTALVQSATHVAATDAAATTAPATESYGPPAPTAEELKQEVADAAPAKIEEPKASSKTAAKDDEDCKKFIPAVGVTVSVGC